MSSIQKDNLPFRYFRSKYDKIKKIIENNLAIISSISAFAIGGLTLLFYALSIGQLPEFTWNDLTGTLLAVCITGVLVVVSIVGYCLLAGYFSRMALEYFYPESALHSLATRSTGDSPSPAYQRILQGQFILGITCFAILAWLRLTIGVSTDRLIPPYQEHLNDALAIALIALPCLVLTDWRRFRRQTMRYALLSVLIGSLVTIIVTIAASSLGPDSLVIRSQQQSAAGSNAIDCRSYCVAALDHAISAGWYVALGITALLGRRPIISRLTRVANVVRTKFPSTSPGWIWPRRLKLLGIKWIRFIAGDRDDLRLVAAKLTVGIAFCFFMSGVFFTAFAMAKMGDTHNRYISFLFTSVLLTVLNFACFSARDWKERAGLGVVTASLVFIAFPLLTQNFFMFPRMVVSLLGLGNERLSSIALSTKQCSTLAPYGVSCTPDNERTITLTNINLLNRIGSSFVLELLAKANAPESMTSAAFDAPAKVSDASTATRPAVTRISLAAPALAAGGRPCDTVLLSQVVPSDPVDAKALRCIELVVPKEQVFGYTTSSARSYRGGYTEYLQGPAPSTKVVKLILDRSKSPPTSGARLVDDLAR